MKRYRFFASDIFELVLLDLAYGYVWVHYAQQNGETREEENDLAIFFKFRPGHFGEFARRLFRRLTRILAPALALAARGRRRRRRRKEAPSLADLIAKKLNEGETLRRQR